MKPFSLAVAAIGLLAPAVVSATDGDAVATGHQASVSLRVEQPNRGLDGWHALRLEFASTPGNWQRAWHVAAVTEERFGESDQGLEFGAALPLDEHWLLQSEVGFAPGADFLPRRHADLRLVRRFDGGVLATFGWRGSRYRDQRADRALVSLERYLGDWRLAWTGNLVRVDGRHAPGHELAVDRYYGDRDSIGLRLARGQELIPLAGGARAFAEVRSAALVGRHWLAPQWGLQWGVGHVDQSGLYDRGWVQLGLQHAW